MTEEEYQIGWQAVALKALDEAETLMTRGIQTLKGKGKSSSGSVDSQK